MSTINWVPGNPSNCVEMPPNNVAIIYSKQCTSFEWIETQCRFCGRLGNHDFGIGIETMNENEGHGSSQKTSVGTRLFA